VSEDTGENGELSHRSPLRRTLDLCVFAPVGLAVTVVEDLPDLISKGRRRVELELGNARVVGRFVVKKGQRRVSGTLDDFRHSGSEERVEPVAQGTAPGHAAASVRPPAPAPPARDTAAAAVVGGALSDYDTLSASQVVPRLESLGTEELQAVLRYEASHRNRRTILHRASQLLEVGPDATERDTEPAPQPGKAE
jgi:hypothetical protein